MTGRDYKKLIKLHRDSANKLESTANDQFKYLSKLVDNSKLLKKYTPVDYDLYKNFINERKQAANNSLVKVKQLEDCNKLKKEALFSQHHTIIWLKEWSKLASQYKFIEAELEDLMKLFENNSVDYVDLCDDREGDEDENEELNKFFKSKNILDELEQFKQNLNDERIKFKLNTVYPINELKEDLQYYLRITPDKFIKINEEKNNEILSTVRKVKDQQILIYSNLENECKFLVEDIDDQLKEINQNELQVVEGIPDNAFDMECPDDELKVSVLQEFLIIDFKYKEKLNNLNESHKYLLDLNAISKFGGWSQQDHDLFQHIYEQYHNHNINLVNCNFSLRDLMFDRMSRTFGSLQNNERKYNRSDFVKHEEWSESNKFYQQQQKLIINEWKESRKGFLLKAEAIFAEAFDMIEQQRIKREEKEKQLKICIDLYEKVIKWRNQKLEALEIQQKIDAMIKRQNAEKSRIENERKQQLRQQQKEAIANRQHRIEASKQQAELKEKLRLEKIEEALREQALKDKQRVEHRNKDYMNRKAELKAIQKNKQDEEAEKEKRLEKFYKSVKPNVEADPARMISFTEAELNRRGIHQNDNQKYVETKQLFNNYSFNDKQLNQDSRTRIEQRLRAAGLIKSEYAKQIINNLRSQAPQMRRDLKENSLWTES